MISEGELESIRGIRGIVEEQIFIPPGKGIKHMSITFEGSPVEGARVEVYNDQGILVKSEISNEEGGVSLPLDPGWYHVVATKGDLQGVMYFEVVLQEHIWNELVLARVPDGDGCLCTEEILEVKHQIEGILHDISGVLDSVYITERQQLVFLNRIVRDLQVADFSEIKQILREIKECACPRPDLDLTEIKQMLQHLTECACPTLPGEWCTSFEVPSSECYAKLTGRSEGRIRIVTQWYSDLAGLIKFPQSEEILDAINPEVRRYFGVDWEDFLIDDPPIKKIFANTLTALVLEYRDQIDGKRKSEVFRARIIKRVPAGYGELFLRGRIQLWPAYKIYNLLEVFNEAIYRIVLRANEQRITTGMMVKMLTDLDHMIDYYSYGFLMGGDPAVPTLQWNVIYHDAQVDRGDLIATPLAVMQRILKVHVDIPPIEIPPDERIDTIIEQLTRLEELVEKPKIVTVVERVPWYVWGIVIGASIFGGGGLIYGAVKRKEGQ